MRRMRVFLPPGRRAPFHKGVAGSAVVHAVVLGLLLWQAWKVGTPAMPRAPGGLGPLGGGGGGSGNVQYIELPPLASDAAQDATRQPRQPVTELPLPKPQLKQIPETTTPLSLPDKGLLVKVEDVASGAGGGGAGGAGAGPGSGGGVGAGQGTGVGNAAGAGTGGQGGDTVPPEPRQLVLPPPDPPSAVRGVEYTVTFSIDARGRVTRVDVAPSIADGDYRRKFMERMREMQFYPARSLDGTTVAAQLVMIIVPGG